MTKSLIDDTIKSIRVSGDKVEINFKEGLKISPETKRFFNKRRVLKMSALFISIDSDDTDDLKDMKVSFEVKNPKRQEQVSVI